MVSLSILDDLNLFIYLKMNIPLKLGVYFISNVCNAVAVAFRICVCVCWIPLHKICLIYFMLLDEYSHVIDIILHYLNQKLRTFRRSKWSWAAILTHFHKHGSNMQCKCCTMHFRSTFSEHKKVLTWNFFMKLLNFSRTVFNTHLTYVFVEEKMKKKRRWDSAEGIPFLSQKH